MGISLHCFYRRPITEFLEHMQRCTVCTCQLAQVCRRSCQQKSFIPAFVNASRHAFVLVCLTGFSALGKTQRRCLPRHASKISIALSLNGTANALPFLVFSPRIQAV